MSEFPLDLYPPADFTREDILRQIFGEVGNLCHGEPIIPMLTALIFIRPELGSIAPTCYHLLLIYNPSMFLAGLVVQIIQTFRLLVRCGNKSAVTWSYVCHE